MVVLFPRKGVARVFCVDIKTAAMHNPNPNTNSLLPAVASCTQLTSLACYPE